MAQVSPISSQRAHLVVRPRPAGRCPVWEVRMSSDNLLWPYSEALTDCVINHAVDALKIPANA